MFSFYSDRWLPLSTPSPRIDIPAPPLHSRSEDGPVCMFFSLFLSKKRARIFFFSENVPLGFLAFSFVRRQPVLAFLPLQFLYEAPG